MGLIDTSKSRRVALFTVFILAASLSAKNPACAEQRARHHSLPRHAAAGPLEEMRREANANTVSIISGAIAGSNLRYAADIASVVDDGDRMRVLPILSAGAVQNVEDIMLLKGVDMGLVRSDSVEALRRDGKYGDIENKIQFITRLADDEMHVVAPREINDLSQLAGKKVNFDVVGSGAHFSSELIFERLGLKVEATSYEPAVAHEKLKAGEIDASVFFGGKPTPSVAGFSDPQHRFHLVPVRYGQKFEDYYLPATLTSKDYPNLLGKDETIETIAAPTLLAVYNLSTGNERYQRVARFVDAFFSRFPELLKPPRHPKWKEVNLAATMPGWTRFKPAQDWLDRIAAAATAGPQGQSVQTGASQGGSLPSTGGARGADAQTAPAIDEVERFKRFVQKRRGKSGAELSHDDTVKMFQDYQKWSGGR